jgi:hypothetical protein
VDPGEFLTLTLSGMLVNLAGIAVTVWLSHRSLKRNLDAKTRQQTSDIASLTSRQTGTIATLTDDQTEVLLRHRWWRRRSSRHAA